MRQMLDRVRSAAALGLILVASWLCAPVADAGWGRGIKPLRISRGKASTMGDTGLGSTIDLAFAYRSDTACWPKIRNKHFSGKHVFYALSIPANSELIVTATPRDSRTDVSLYGYSMGTTRFDVPPKIRGGLVACEASFGSRNMKKPFNPGKAEKIRLVAKKNPYNVVIGVAAAAGAARARFKLEAKLTTAAAAPTGRVRSTTRISAKPARKVTVRGQLARGVQIPLKWAANSSVACFPATRFDHFNGNHVVYEFALPPYTVATIRALPKSGALDLSLYAYTVGPKTKMLPPKVPSVVSCEASYGPLKMNRSNPGKPESVRLQAIKNPYKVYVAVVGAKKTTRGSFDLEVSLSAGGGHRAQWQGQVGDQNQGQTQWHHQRTRQARRRPADRTEMGGQ